LNWGGVLKWGLGRRFEIGNGFLVGGRVLSLLGKAEFIGGVGGEFWGWGMEFFI